MNAIPVFEGSKPWTATLHTHSRFCDGKLDPADYADSAIREGLTFLGFSSHAPVPDPPGAAAVDLFWSMPAASVNEYLRTIQELKLQHRDCLDIRTGLEVDYIPDIMGPAHPMIQSLKLDYTIGSVHVAGCRDDGTMWTVDCGPEKFTAGIHSLFGGSIRAAGCEYYRRIRQMVTEAPPDIIGHFDLFKKNNKLMEFIDESETWYRDAVFETLDCISDSRCILEVNTGGIARGFADEPYPSMFILKRCRQLNIPVMLNSDAHHPDNLTRHFDLASDMLRAAGY